VVASFDEFDGGSAVGAFLVTFFTDNLLELGIFF
jgi:hypothetical protein